MIHETCPDELVSHQHDTRAALERTPRPPGLFALFGPPILLLVSVVLVAALHAALGLPLGPAFAGEVWSLAKTLLVGGVAYSGFGVYVYRHNKAALVHSPPSALPSVTQPQTSPAHLDYPGSARHPPELSDPHSQPPALPSGRKTSGHRIITPEVIDTADDRRPPRSR